MGRRERVQTPPLFSQEQTPETRHSFAQAAWRRTETEEAASPAAGAGAAANRPDRPPPPRFTGPFDAQQPNPRQRRAAASWGKDDCGLFLRFHLAGEHGALTCSHLQSYDPDRALSDYISRLEALQRRLGSVTSGTSRSPGSSSHLQPFTQTSPSPQVLLHTLNCTLA